MNSLASRKPLILALTCVAQFMVVLDIAIVNVALPSMQHDLGLRESELQWVVIAYGLMLGGFLLLGGRLGDLLGRRRIFLTGIALFSIASLCSGLAQSSSVLIAARAFQGFGAALIAPTALSILAVTFTEGKERNGALGIYGAVGGSSASVGVIASGLLTDGPGWRWIFFINVPIGAALLLLGARFLPVDQIRAIGRQYDAAGATTVTSGLLALVYGLNRGADHGWISSSTLGIFALAVILLAGFVAIESRAAAPLVPFAALKNRTRTASNLAAFCLFSAFFSFIFLGSLFMQQHLGYSPTRTGVAWLATSLTAFVAAGIAGAQLVAKIGVRRLLVTGMALMTIGAAWLTRAPAHPGYLVDLLPGFLLAGTAIGLCAPAVQIGALTKVTGPGVGLASGLVETMREIGGAVGIAAVSTALISHAGDSGAGQFKAAFFAIVVFAATGIAVASFGFPRREDASVPEFAAADRGTGFEAERAA